MSLGNQNFDAISEQDLQTLVDNGVSEGRGLDFKEETYGRNDADIKEFLKDISSFANTIGGYLVVGMAEKEGIASELKGIAVSDVDAELQRFESLLRDGIEPRIVGTMLKAIYLANGKHALVFRVSRSWNPPHRVSTKNTNRFYLRNSSGVHEASVEELRVLFSQASTIQDRTKAYRHERLSAIRTGNAPVQLANHFGKLVLHIVPYSAFSTPGQVDLRAALENSNGLQPLGQISGHTPKINFDGFINVRGGDQCFGYTQLFRDGRLEAAKVRVVMEREGIRILPMLTFDRDILNRFGTYLDTLQKLDVEPPLVAMISLLEVRGAILGVNEGGSYFDEPDAINRDDLLLPEIVIEQYGEAQGYQRALRPAFDALWNAGGFTESQYFASDGTWKGPSSR